VTTARLQVEHTTRFTYSKDVPGSYNECRLLPTSDSRQQVLSARVVPDPVTWRQEYVDYWGTRVVSFESNSDHRVLAVVAQLDAVVSDPPAPPTAGWDVVRDPQARDRYGELLVPTTRSAPGEELAALAADAAGDLAPSQAALAVCRLVRERLTYRSGSTGVQTLATEAWAERQGVCQDFAHLAVGALRSVGVPARYVSGYLHPRSGAAIGERVTGESHAWVEWWAGEWFGFDPTNDVPAGRFHLAVGRGRDYGDVPPVRGIVAGGGKAQLKVEVAVTRVA
jgi:transglutaminase-like putative cysteine protease